jgi:hypothetical protein
MDRYDKPELYGEREQKPKDSHLAQADGHHVSMLHGNPLHEVGDGYARYELPAHIESRR